jgi:mannose-6-phosphate isomerase-like protein (cupin superfamily)
MILEGVVDATFDDERYRLGPGDVAWAGAGCVHAFSNPGPGHVRWLETQAPQPPARHSYRFARDWISLRERLG